MPLIFQKIDKRYCNFCSIYNCHFNVFSGRAEARSHFQLQTHVEKNFNYCIDGLHLIVQGKWNSSFHSWKVGAVCLFSCQLRASNQIFVADRSAFIV